MSPTLGAPSGSQPTTSNNTNIPRVLKHRMPKPGEKNAPEFDPEKPEELGRFFERMEDYFLDEEIMSNAEMKKKIVKYLDADSEVQWKVLSMFTTGTYEDLVCCKVLCSSQSPCIQMHNKYLNLMGIKQIITVL